MLYVFYQFFHPWVSEGISVGFEPGREKRNDMVEGYYYVKDHGNDRPCSRCESSPDVQNQLSESVDPYGTTFFILTLYKYYKPIK